MARKIYILPKISKEEIAAAEAAGCTEIVRGIPASLKDIVREEDLPFAYIEPEPPPPEPALVVPDVRGFKSSFLMEFGVALTNTLLAKYPLFNESLLVSNFDAASQILGLAVASGDITQVQADAIKAMGAAFNLPI